MTPMTNQAIPPPMSNDGVLPSNVGTVSSPTGEGGHWTWGYVQKGVLRLGGTSLDKNTFSKQNLENPLKRGSPTGGTSMEGRREGCFIEDCQGPRNCRLERKGVLELLKIWIQTTNLKNWSGVHQLACHCWGIRVTNELPVSTRLTLKEFSC